MHNFIISKNKLLVDILKSNNLDNNFYINKINSSDTVKSFCYKVENLIDYIIKGDIFQAVISRRYEIDYEGKCTNVFLRMVYKNPSPYMFYLKLNEKRIFGCSPETLVSLRKGIVETYPIAGTIPRFGSPIKDAELRKELLKSKKDAAEHAMLVDLARNDLSKVCLAGTVKVDYYRKVVTYSHVQHIVSKVSGIKRKDKTNIEVLCSSFPAGTVSGAPKIRAIEIINELENFSRGPYAGAIGYFNGNSSFDFAINIRSVFALSNKAYVQAGAGIVYDSDPHKEYLETENKMKFILESMEIPKQFNYLT